MINETSFGGAGCSVYLPTLVSFERTTDLGVSWTNFPIPLTTTPYEGGFSSNESVYAGTWGFSVTGNGADVYIIDDSGFMWRTTDGGDGTMSETTPLYEITMTTALPSGSVGDTLFTTTCDSTKFSFHFQYTGTCSNAHLDSVSISGLDTGEYRLRFAASASDTANLPDTGWVAIQPAASGIRAVSVHCYYIDQDKNIRDTSFTVVLDVSSTPGRLVLNAKALYDFGTQSLCYPVPVRDSFSIAGFGCTTPVVDSMTFRPDSANFKDFSFKAIRTYISDSIPKYFPISFKPSMADTERGSIFVYWNDGEVQHVDTIRVEGAGVEATRSFAVGSPAVTVQMCDSTIGTITFTNTTCGLLELDSLALPAGMTLPLKPSLDPQLPLFLKAGTSDSLVVTISPGAEGRAGSTDLRVGDTVLQVPAHLKYTDKGGTTAFDTTITLTIHVERGIPQALLSDTVLDFGTVSTCDSATLPLVISSVGCDTLSGIGYRVSGMGYRVSGIGNRNLVAGWGE